MITLFGPITSVSQVNPLLAKRHYLGPSKRGHFAWSDPDGVMVFAHPTSRHLPADWLELVRWCLLEGRRNAGSSQWARFIRWARDNNAATTVVSYSDPSAGHNGALYRACGWLWAPTWHRLRPPPTANGSWVDGKTEAVKDRWIFILRPDNRRPKVLSINDKSCRRRFPWAQYREPTWRRGKPVQGSGGGDFKQFSQRS